MAAQANVAIDPTLSPYIPNHDRRQGVCFSAANLRDLADPKVKPKIVLGCCVALKDKLGGSNKRVFNIVDAAYLHVIDPMRKLGFRIVGQDQDSFTMLEVCAGDYPAAWELEEKESKNMVVISLKQRLPDTLAAVNTFDDITDAMWDSIIGVIDKNLEDSSSQSRFYGLLASAIYSICRQGAFTRSTAEHLTTELSESHGVAISISPTGVKGYWSALGKTYKMGTIQGLMDWMLPHFQNSVRLSNLVSFSKKRGLNIYYQVKEAISTFPTFCWDVVFASAKIDFENYLKARDLVQDRDYYGYNADIGCAAASFYPNLGYVCLRLNEVVGGKKTLDSLNSRVKTMVNTARWDKLVREYRDKMEDGILSEEQLASSKIEVDNFWVSMIRPPGDPRPVHAPNAVPSTSQQQEESTGPSGSESSSDEDNNDDPPAGAGGSRLSSQGHSSTREPRDPKPPRRNDGVKPKRPRLDAQADRPLTRRVRRLPQITTDKDLQRDRTIANVDSTNLISKQAGLGKTSKRAPKTVKLTTENVWDALARTNVSRIDMLLTATEMERLGEITMTMPIVQSLKSWVVSNGFNMDDYIVEDETTSSQTMDIENANVINDSNMIPPYSPMLNLGITDQTSDEEPDDLLEREEGGNMERDDISNYNANLMPVTDILTDLGLPSVDINSYRPLKAKSFLNGAEDTIAAKSLFGIYRKHINLDRAPRRDLSMPSGLTLRLGDKLRFWGWVKIPPEGAPNHQQVVITQMDISLYNTNSPVPFLQKNAVIVTYPSDADGEWVPIAIGYNRIKTWEVHLRQNNAALYVTADIYIHIDDIFNPLHLVNFTSLFWALLLRASLSALEYRDGTE